jgi:hypothetical protein
MSKVISIQDSKVGESGQTAYFKGQIFELLDREWPFDWEIVIWNHNFGFEMVCSSKNFVSLPEWRLQRIRQILMSDCNI